MDVNILKGDGIISFSGTFKVDPVELDAFKEDCIIYDDEGKPFAKFKAHVVPSDEIGEDGRATFDIVNISDVVMIDSQGDKDAERSTG